MIRAKIRSGYLAVTIMIILLGIPFPEVNASKSQVPEGLVIEKTFKAGTGSPVGLITMVNGEVIIIHSAEMQIGYMAEKNLPLFKGDTIISKDKSRIQFKFSDGTTLTMASNSKLAITQSIYEPKAKSRSSFIKMGFGKIRFIVRKFTGFKVSEFKVKTKTAVIGVRGSDFIISSSEDSTEITTLKNTVLEVTSITDPETPSVLTDFEQASVESGRLPSEAKKMQPDEIEQMILEMVVPQDITAPDETLRVRREDTVRGKGERDIVGKPFEKSFEHETGKSFAKPEYGKPFEKFNPHKTEKLLAGHGQPDYPINTELEIGRATDDMHADMPLHEFEQGRMNFTGFESGRHEGMGHHGEQMGNMMPDEIRDEIHKYIEEGIKKSMDNLPSFPSPPAPEYQQPQHQQQ
ncbi:MAG: FecR domain-containing protein [Desulfobacteraceae bacterium]|nr:FecR domain-containing protein [Desulfobacteraceae bacterium]